MCIVHKGFRGMRSIVSRFDFGNCGYERSPQSLTGHTANDSFNNRSAVKIWYFNEISVNCVILMTELWIT